MKNENLLGRISLPVLYQPFARKIEQLSELCRQRGIEYWAISGERTWDEQAALYAQGRSVPGKIVTKARAGFSAHNFAIAVDFCPDKDMTRAGLQPDWDEESYEVLAVAARELGLESGFYWKFKDAPHVQLPLEKRGITLEKLRAAYNTGGKRGVFRLLDQYRW